MTTRDDLLVTDEYKYGFHVPERYEFKSRPGLTRDTVIEISKRKAEPEWMLNFRLRALDIFHSKPMPTWGADLSSIEFDAIHYYIKPSGQKHTWEEVPEEIKETFDRLGIPEAEKKFLAGVGAQYESEVVYHNLKASWEEQGVIFLDTDSALREHPDLFRKYFGSVIPPEDNKFAALNSAVWSGGSFIYVPAGVHIDVPLQAYFRINAEAMGQFERTLIIAGEGSSVHYVEGCTAPIYSRDSLHSAVVEIIVQKGARVQYTTIQNWSSNVYNLVTKRAVAEEDATMIWVDGNLGSKTTMKYPAVILKGRGSRADILSLAMAGKNQHQDAGAKVTHVAPDTTSTITSKSVSLHGGRSSYRGLVKIHPEASGSRVNVQCDALILDPSSSSDTFPYMEVGNSTSYVEHEASVSKVSEDQLFYLASRGIPEEEARAMIVSGFVESIVRELPMEYAVEMNRLIQLQMEGSVG
ncbi:MAG TPA: Fe-S cluster assembly protein SufB [Thermoanaerobaculia bacterium]|nr:Fe-S cluster assembly protein SufB [Thermoanaerobaculia bacterium]HUM28821.1 Fe-S cluster assembly protein SufB [Thermoanaerobaculia bacterium]HXK69078.1 Fe-S cluster assembly protein SufB [Thermoanaerobaculia bacterium]